MDSSVTAVVAEVVVVVTVVVDATSDGSESMSVSLSAGALSFDTMLSEMSGWRCWNDVSRGISHLVPKVGRMPTVSVPSTRRASRCPRTPTARL